jgi:hypothetical protein
VSPHVACVHIQGSVSRYMDTSNGAGGVASYEDIQYDYIEYSVYAAAGEAGAMSAIDT